MAVTIDVKASLVAALKNSGGGENQGAMLGLLAKNSNSAGEISGVLYVLVTDFSNTPSAGQSGTSTFQMYSSSDSGATWATVGSAFSPSRCGGGMNTFVVGTKIWVGFTRSILDGGSPDSTLRLAHFETAGSTWSSETTIDLSTLTVAPQVDGPYATYVRPDGTFLFVLAVAAAPSVMLIAAYDGVSWTAATFAAFGFATQLYDSSIMEADGTVHVFYYRLDGVNIHYHRQINPDNTFGAATVVTAGANLEGYFDNGLGIGYEASGTFFLGVGKHTGVSGQFGQPAILYGSPGSWTIGALLDTDGTMDNYSLSSVIAAKIGSNIFIYWRGALSIPDSSNDIHFIDRVGYAPVGSHDTPGAWTWATVWDSVTPVPSVPTESPTYHEGGYRASGQQTDGANSGIQITSTGMRLVSTLLNSAHDLFVSYIFGVTSTSPVVRFGNEFR